MSNAGVGAAGLAFSAAGGTALAQGEKLQETRNAQYIASGKSKKLIRNGYVITMDEKYGDITDGAVLVENDTIIGIGRSSEFSGIDAEIIDAQGGIILPGMIDSHRHTWLSLLRGISADMSLPEFLASTFYGIGSVMEAEDIRMATLVGALEALDAGVTTILDCCDCVNSPAHADAAVESLRASGIRSVYAYGMQSYDYKGKGFRDHQHRLKKMKELHQQYFSNEHPLNHMGILLSDFGTIPFAQTASEIETAHELGLFVASNTGAAAKSILLKGLYELKHKNLLKPGYLHIHCTALDEPEWQILAETGAKVSIAPETEMQMGMGRPPFRTCLNHGIKPGISTDIVCVVSGDLFSQMRLGLQFQRCMDHEDHSNRTGKMATRVDLSVRDALTWATHGSAEALGMEKQIGSLTPNKKADVIIISQTKAFVPSSYPVGSAVFQTTASDVDTVIINGEVRKRHGQLVQHDVQSIRTNAQQALKRIQKAASKLPVYTADDIEKWFAKAEEGARSNYAQAFKG